MLISGTLKVGDTSIDEVIKVLDGRFDYRFYEPNLSLELQMNSVSIVVDWQGNPSPEFLNFAKQIELWQLLLVGTENFDFSSWKYYGINVEICPSSTSANALAETCLMLMLMLLRRTNEARQSVLDGRLSYPSGEELNGKNLLIYGFGASGQALAKLIKPFGVKVRVIDEIDFSENELLQFGIQEPVFATSQLYEMAGWCDILSIHVPLTPKTTKVINRSFFAKMKPGGYLVNIARGAIIDEEALLDAIEHGVLSGAALDVVETEPINPNNPFFKSLNFIVTPHIAGNTLQTAIRKAKTLRDNIEKLKKS